MESVRKHSNYLEQRLELLKLKPEFLLDVKEFRRRWKLPTRGLKDDNERAEWDKWLDGYDKEEKIKFEANPNSTEKDVFQLPNYLYSYEFHELARKYKFHENIEHIFKNYIFFNDFYKDYLLNLKINKNARVRLFTQSEFGNEYKDKDRIYIEIFSDTTIEDMAKTWKSVKCKQKKAIGYKDGRRRPKVYLERDIFIWKLSRKGLSHEEIREQIKNLPTCGKIYIQDISKIIAKISKKIREA